jgi:hypothetical protein
MLAFPTSRKTKKPPVKKQQGPAGHKLAGFLTASVGTSNTVSLGLNFRVGP